MYDNYKQIPDMIDLASEIGLDEVKVVYFTSFKDELDNQTLFNKQNEVRSVFDEAVRRADKLGVKIKLPYIQGDDPAGDDLHRPCYVVWRDLFIGSDGYIRPCMSTPVKFIHIDDVESIDEIWNHPLYQKFRATINDNVNMEETCKTCYQSSVTNWNHNRSWIQHGLNFAPEWDDTEES
ncbi:MAG TPA: SPASM domain-containing protein [Methanocorpusculum sp.]|nr:SPASM domain-containing protein [Methanocorpusculum sp.]